jgi:hypothetical protein
MRSSSASAALATVTVSVVGYLVKYARRYWIQPADSWWAALSQIVFAVVLAVALSSGLTLSVLLLLPLSDLMWLKVLLLTLTIVGPWVVIWKVLDMQRRRLDKSWGKPRTAQALLHTWLTVQIGSTLTVSFAPIRHLVSGYNTVFTVLSILMGLAVLFLPGFRRETFKLLSRRAHVEIRQASGLVSRVIFGLVFLWAYLSSAACPHRQCVADGSPGFIWALVFSLGSAWLIATFLIQLASILRWMDDRSRNPGPPPPWLARIVHIIGRPRSA